MAYHQSTIRLQRTGNHIAAVGFCGLDVDLPQVEKAIHELEAYLSAKDGEQASHQSWEPGELIVPSNAQVQNATMRDKELWARHMDSDGKLPPPGCVARDRLRHERKMLNQAKTIHGQIARHQQIAQFLVERQQAFLQSGNWMDKVRLTILEVAEQMPEWAEKTVRSSVHSLSFAFEGNTFTADTLICTSDMPALCKQIVTLQKEAPNAGAPLLTSRLNAQGVQVSERMVGNALQLLAKHKARQLA